MFSIFLLTNEKYLRDEQAFYEYGAVARCAVEEQAAPLEIPRGLF